ncbi:MAG: 4-demethylwyosine synthase TYW1 [Candidatus Bathyarchaeia archaeon]
MSGVELQTRQLVEGDYLSNILKREKYQLIGSHSAVKKCRWLHESLVNKRPCYKQKFYGISSHRCVQMTPTLYNCTLRCLFCWRLQPSDLGLEFDETRLDMPDEPSFIVEKAIEAQRRILSGYKTHKKIDPERYGEALNPKHAAISLSGEPTLYQSLGDLLREFHRRGMTTFLVTNGTQPKALARLSHEPSQLYLSLYAYDESVFERICRPQVTDGWKNIKESLDLLRSFKCPTVIRLTLVRGLNLQKPDGYAKLILKGCSTYVEAKSYMYVGFSRRRLRFENMPTHEEILSFSRELSRLTGYKLIDESVESRVVLLSSMDKPKKLG